MTTTTTIQNRKARFRFFLYEKFEAGIALLGCEVKSIREGRVNLSDSFVRVMKNEAFLFNCHITTYSKIQGYTDIDPIRIRKLLLNRAELQVLEVKMSQKGFSIVPLQMYFKKGKVKVEIALAKGKKLLDKREDIKRRMHDRESAAAVKQHRRNT